MFIKNVLEHGKSLPTLWVTRFHHLTKKSQYKYIGIWQCSIKQLEIASISLITKNHAIVTEVKWYLVFQKPACYYCKDELSQPRQTRKYQVSNIEVFKKSLVTGKIVLGLHSNHTSFQLPQFVL